MQNPKRWLQPHSYSNCRSWALLALRLIVGSAFALHGWGKMQHPFGWMPPDAPVPGLLQFLAAFAEFGGGIAWILGLLTPLASLGIGFTMVVATFMVAVAMKKPFVDPMGGLSYELALSFLGVSLVLLAFGPGKFSLDHKLFGERR